MAWNDPSTVAGFAAGRPNDALIRFARAEAPRSSSLHALDIGCGAGRNAMPLAEVGWEVIGVDTSEPMLRAASERQRRAAPTARAAFVVGAMDRLPVAARSFDLIVAHGIWNLARTGDEFRRAVREAARTARPGAALFVYLFSRSTLSKTAIPIRGESFVFTHLDNQPHCFLTQVQVIDELGAAGFVAHPGAPLREINPRSPGMLVTVGSPVLWEGGFRRAP